MGIIGRGKAAMIDKKLNLKQCSQCKNLCASIRSNVSKDKKICIFCRKENQALGLSPLNLQNHLSRSQAQNETIGERFEALKGLARASGISSIGRSNHSNDAASREHFHSLPSQSPPCERTTYQQLELIGISSLRISSSGLSDFW